MAQQKKREEISRRSFLSSAAAVGTGLVLSPRAFGVTTASSDNDIHVALIGAGDQGLELLSSCAKIPGIRVTAVCDIWTDYNQQRASGMLKELGLEHKTYEDYQNMLEKEKNLDAAIVATPDFWHAEQSVACLKAGLHVYCESEMSHTLEGARKMVQAARETGKLLQIGRQRRSNRRYVHCGKNLVNGVKLFGKIMAVNAQWNRSVQPDRGWPRRAPLDEATLKRYGFKSMQQFRNWRWYKGLGGGPIVQFGSHQIDVFNWFLRCYPRTVMASGGTEYYDDKTHEWHDTVIALFEYEAKWGTVRVSYQTITTNGNGGNFESFLGDKGTLTISEPPGQSGVYREPTTHGWNKWVKLRYLAWPDMKEGEEEEEEEAEASTTFVMEDKSKEPPTYNLPATADEPNHKPHLENFFNAIRGSKKKLNCPGEVGYATLVTVLKVNEAMETGRKLTYKSEEFEV